MTRHSLKLNDRYFDAVRYGIKTFEIIPEQLCRHIVEICENIPLGGQQRLI